MDATVGEIMRELGTYDEPTTKDGKIYDPVAEYLKACDKNAPPKDTRTVAQYMEQETQRLARKGKGS